MTGSVVATTASAAALRIWPVDAGTKRGSLSAAIRLAIRERYWQPGVRVPSTRSLADDLGLARNTVASVYDELVGEGLLEVKPGIGSFVTSSLTLPRTPPASVGMRRAVGVPVSHRSRAATTPTSGLGSELGPPTPFRSFAPEMDELSVRAWSRLAAACWNDERARRRGDRGGLHCLRSAISEHLNLYRGIRCDVDQVVVVAGSQQGLTIALELVADPGDRVAVGDPVRPAALVAIHRAAVTPTWVPPSHLHNGHCPAVGCRAALISPNHDLTGDGALSEVARRELVHMAAHRGMWIVEDDPTGDLHLVGNSHPSLYALDPSGCVIHVGTFSASMSPALRLGFVVVPDGLGELAATLRACHDVESSAWLQMTLAAFMRDGHYARLVARARHRYRERQELLLELISSDAAGHLLARPSQYGLHLIARVRGSHAVAAAARAGELGVEAQPVRSVARPGTRANALQLGFAGHGGLALRDAYARLSQAIGIAAGEADR